LENVIAMQKEASELAEFKNICLTLDCIDWLTITSPNIPDISTTFISLKKDYIHVSVVLFVAINTEVVRQPFTEVTLVNILQKSPFASRVRILD